MRERRGERERERERERRGVEREDSTLAGQCLSQRGVDQRVCTVR